MGWGAKVHKGVRWLVAYGGEGSKRGAFVPIPVRREVVIVLTSKRGRMPKGDGWGNAGAGAVRASSVGNKVGEGCGVTSAEWPGVGADPSW